VQMETQLSEIKAAIPKPKTEREQLREFLDNEQRVHCQVKRELGGAEMDLEYRVLKILKRIQQQTPAKRKRRRRGASPPLTPPEEQEEEEELEEQEEVEEE